MGLDDRPADGEPDPESFSFRRHEGVKNTIGELLGDPVAMIDYGHTDGVAIVERLCADTYSLFLM